MVLDFKYRCTRVSLWFVEYDCHQGGRINCDHAGNSEGP